MKLGLLFLVAVGAVVGFVAFPGKLEAGEFDIDLLEPGAEPRTPLRLAVREGAQPKTTLSVEMDMGIQARGMSGNRMEMPAVSMAITTEVLDAPPGGDIHFNFGFTDVGLRDAGAARSPTAAGMLEAMLWLEDVSGYGVMNGQGIARSLELDLERAPPEARKTADSMKQSLHHLTIPIPEEPVGVGGRWRARWGLNVDGVAIEMEGTFKVLSRKDDVLRLEVELAQTAEEQEVRGIPGMPKGAKITLRSLESTGRGELELDLSRLLPRSGRIQVSSETSIEASMKGQSQKMTMNVNMEMVISS